MLVTEKGMNGMDLKENKECQKRLINVKNKVDSIKFHRKFTESRWKREKYG